MKSAEFLPLLFNIWTLYSNGIPKWQTSELEWSASKAFVVNLWSSQRTSRNISANQPDKVTLSRYTFCRVAYIISSEKQESNVA